MTDSSARTNPGTAGIIERYRRYLPVTEQTPNVSLGEGSTPLIHSNRIGPGVGLENLYFKFEGLNPTGSFKDRGMALATAKALEEDSRILLCASTGNTSASAAAYAARYSLACAVVLPAGHVAVGKVAQALAYGAVIVPVDASFDKALELVRQLSSEQGVALVNSVNPYRIEGQKTAAFEIVEHLGRAPDRLFIPVGNAGNITAYWRGFTELHAERGSGCPRMHGAQSQGAAPIVTGKPVKKPETIASAIRIGNPASWKTALQARDESHGSIQSVTDRQILDAQRLLASREGLVVEPASAAALALLLKLTAVRAIQPNETIVCVLTGHGLKDPKTLTRGLRLPQAVSPTLTNVRRTLARLRLPVD